MADENVLNARVFESRNVILGCCEKLVVQASHLWSVCQDSANLKIYADGFGDLRSYSRDLAGGQCSAARQEQPHLSRTF